MAKSIGFKIHLEINGQDVVIKCKNGIQDLGKALGTIPPAADKAGTALRTMGSVSAALQGMYSGLQQITSVMDTYIAKSNAAAESQTKLTTIMRQRMAASDSDISSLNELISAQTKLGVVSGTVQRSGLQQLATFASQRSTLATLLPAMNNLLVQQNGLNSTSEAAVGVANLMGKALMGNYAALKRVGITFSDAQAELIKYGDEGTRAATIAEVITQNVGNMNAEMAKTDAGKAKQAANEIGGLQVKLGQLFSQYQSAIMMFGQVGMAVTGIAQLTNGIIGTVKALFSLTAVTQLATFNNRVATAVVRGFTIAMGMSTVSITGATIAVKALTWALRALEVASVIGTIFAGLSIAFDVMAGSANKASDASKRLSNNMGLAQQEADKTSKSFEGGYSRTLGNLKASYSSLQSQWKALSNEHQKKQWIEANRSAFENLGVSVNSVTDAENVFVNNTATVVKALQARAKAQAAENTLVDLYTRQSSLEEQKRVLDKKTTQTVYKATKVGTRLRNTDGAYSQIGQGFATQENLRNGYIRANHYNYGTGGVGTYYTVTKKGERHFRSQTYTSNGTQGQQISNAQKQVASDIKRVSGDAASASLELQKLNNSLGGKSSPTTNKSTTKTGNATPTTNSGAGNNNTDEVLPKGSIADFNKQISDLNKQRELATDPTDISNIDDKIQKLKSDIEALNMAARQVDIKRLGLDKYRPSELGNFKAVEIPKPDDKEFKDGLKKLSDIINKWADDNKQKVTDTNDAIENAFQSFGGDFANIVEQWKALGKAFDETKNSGIAVGGALVLVGQQMEQIAGDGPAAKVGAVMAAIGQLVLGFATALAQASDLGPWGWIGFAIAGAATLASLIAQVSSFSTGGIVGGTSYHGDKVPAKVNSGEMILTMRQQKNLFDIANGMALPKMPVVSPDTSSVSSMIVQPSVHVTVGGKIQGRDMLLLAKNTKIEYGKIGKEW